MYGLLLKEEPWDIYGELICINNPDGFFFSVGSTYHISGQGNLTLNTFEYISDGTQKYRIGYGGGEGIHGYNLTNDRESFYIPYEILIKNFIYLVDYNEQIFKILRREMTIKEILK